MSGWVLSAQFGAPALLSDVALWAAVVVSVSAAIVAIRKSFLGRAIGWVWKRVAAQPIAAFFGRVVLSVVQPLIADLSRQNAQQHAANDARDAARHSQTQMMIHGHDLRIAGIEADLRSHISNPSAHKEKP